MPVPARSRLGEADLAAAKDERTPRLGSCWIAAALAAAAAAAAAVLAVTHAEVDEDADGSGLGSDNGVAGRSAPAAEATLLLLLCCCCSLARPYLGCCIALRPPIAAHVLHEDEDPSRHSPP